MWKRAGIVFAILLLVFILNAFLNPIPKRKTAVGKKISYGTSYSFEQVSWYGLDPRQTFVDLISESNFEWVRIPFFWNQMVDEKGNLVLDDLKFAIEEAAKKDVKVVIALGAKTPYYPEFHLPENIAAQLKHGEKIEIGSLVANEILEMDKKILEELAVYENISHWQIENEPFTPSENGWTVGEDFIKREIEVVKSADSLNRPVILSHVGPAVFDLRWKRLLNMLDAGDVLSLNAYFKTQAPHLLNLNLLGFQVSIPWPGNFSWPVQSWGFFSPDFGRIKKEAGKKGVDVWVMEMQAEPYIRTLEDARRVSFSYSYNSDDIEKSASYLAGEDITTIGLWGAQFWMFRETLGDSSWLDSVGAIVN